MLPVDDTEMPALLAATRARRIRLAAQMRAAGGGVAVLATAPALLRNRDSDYPYRHDSYFYYLTGFIEPGAALVLIAGERAGDEQAILFCRARDPEREIWDGKRYGPDGARAVFGFDASYPIETLDELMPQWLANQSTVFYPLGRDDAADAQLRGWLDAVRIKARAGDTPPTRAIDVTALLDAQRVVKDSYELDVMRRAAQISAGAHRRAMRTCAPGLREYQLEAELLHEFRWHGAQSVAYNSIVAAGANACILHYRAGNAMLRAGELCLIDAGCELDGYASDITRTFPVDGRFTGPQRALYDLVVAAQQAAVDATKPGHHFMQAHDAAVAVLAQGMLDCGLLDHNTVGTADDVIANKAYARFYMHRTGHWLGMDVHDCGDYRERGAPPNGHAPGWRILVPGMVTTIEPGLYVAAADDVPEQFWNIGIRIEDDAIVTTDGCELITRDVPVAADEIEALMRNL